jgi:hypothetical protein
MRRLAAALARGAAQAQRACGGCDTCGAQADSAVGASAAGDAAKSRSDALGHSNAEVRVPLSRIPRRRPG